MTDRPLVSKAHVPPPVQLRHLVLLALVVRLPAVIYSRGYEFIDAQFMYVDPAYGLAFDASYWQPFVISLGMKSWIYPGVLAGVFRLSDAIGLTGAEAMMIFTRLVHALLSLVPVITFWCFLRQRGFKNSDKILLVFFACNPLLVYSGVQPNAITFAVGLSLTAVFASQCRGRSIPFLGGLALGLAFACRFQDAAFGPPIFVAGLLQRRYRETCWFSLGCLLGLAIQGFLDWKLYGSFIHSPVAYVSYNLSPAAKAYGQQSVFLYLGIIAGVLLCVPPFLRSTWLALKVGIYRFPVLFSCSAVHIVAHNMIGRKAFRFVIPSLILLLVIFVAGATAKSVTASDSRLDLWRVWHRRLFFGLQAIALVLVSFTYFHRGAIEAAVTLSTRDDFKDKLIVVDGLEDSIGGYYYLRRRKLSIEYTTRDKLDEVVAGHVREQPLFLLVCNEPLSTEQGIGGLHAESLGSFNSWPRAKRRNARHLYQLRSEVSNVTAK